MILVSHFTIVAKIFISYIFRGIKMWIQNDFDSIVLKYETIERHSSICKYVLQIPSQVATLIIAFHGGFFPLIISHFWAHSIVLWVNDFFREWQFFSVKITRQKKSLVSLCWFQIFFPNSSKTVWLQSIYHLSELEIAIITKDLQFIKGCYTIYNTLHIP